MPVADGSIVLVFSVQPLRSLCLCGEYWLGKRRNAEDAGAREIRNCH